MNGDTGQLLLETPQNTAALCRGRVRSAKILEIKRHGALVRLPDGEEAWLPAKEWFPDIEPNQSLADLAFHHKTDEINVLVFDEIPRGRRRQKLVSFRRVEADPWDAVLAWPHGAVKSMEVELVTATRALGDIATGVRGEVLLETLKYVFTPQWHNHATIRPGDKVAGFVTRQGIDPERRIVTLDVAGFIKSEVRVDEQLLTGALLSAIHPKTLDSSTVSGPLRPSVPTALKRLLIVDDDPDFLHEVSFYLEGQGCEIIMCSSLASMHQRLDRDNNPLDLALIDLHFDTRRYEGLRVALAVQAERPEVPIIIVTGDDTIYADTSFLATEGATDLKVCGVVLKPFGSEGFLRALAASNREPQRLVEVLTGQRHTRITVPSQRVSWRKKLDKVLESLACDIAAGTVALFSLHPVSMKVDILSCMGTDQLVPSVAPNIERSPVRDVAIDHEEVISVDAGDRRDFPKHRWLQRAYRYHSCIAVPVQCPSEYAYALFAFDAQKRRFSDSTYPRMRRAAAEIEDVLYAQRVEARLLSIEPYELLGRSYGSMSHDLRHLLANESTTRRILETVADKTELAGTELEQVRKDLLLLDERLRQAAEIVRTFGEVARGAEQQEEEVMLWPTVQTFLDEFAQQHPRLCREVLISPGYPLSVRVNIRPMGLRQVLFNLILNAVQQISLFDVRQPSKGEIVVELAQESRDDGCWASIRVHDTGPGIHRADFARIFELGYTTKTGGFGMGLDICRRILGRIEANERRGEVKVANSILFVGSTFSVCLPILQA